MATGRYDVGVVLAGLVLIMVAGVVGALLKRAGYELILPLPPLIARWSPHLGWGTPLVLVCVLLGLRLQRLAGRMRWGRLLLLGWLLAVGWTVSLILVDGLDRGWVRRLEDPNEYLHDLPRIDDPLVFLRTFTRFIAFSPTVDGTQVWTTHVAGHPPLATLVFWALDRVGLGGGFWGGLLCILVGSTAALATPTLLRELGAGAAARRLVPFAALFPGAVWVGVSADGLFAGVAAFGLALVARGAVRRRPLSSVAGGLLLGVAVYLSYGLALVGVTTVLVAVLTLRRNGRSVLLCWLLATVGFAAVTVVHLALGFNWFTGLAELRIRYYQGIASLRPFFYFVWANLAAWLISCSPLLTVGLVRAIGVLRRRRFSTPDATVALVALSGLAAALLADLSALSKAETERIWLTFGVVAATGTSLVRGRRARWLLVGWAATAIAVNHLLRTGW